jgi:uncharacterized protein YqjF (DUF2071 family)
MVGLLDAMPTTAPQASVISETEHRPWPLPRSPWLMAQSWADLLFAHWPVEAGSLRTHVPDRLDLDCFDGAAWVGITPFRLEGLRLRNLPRSPFISSFLELNVRTYVSAGGKAGIWFFSLNTSNRLAVHAARAVYHLPCFHARMRMSRHGGWHDQRCERTAFRFAARYRPCGDAEPAAPDSLEHFLAERYCLYAANRDTLYRAEIHHPPWPLQPAHAVITENASTPHGVELGDGDPLLHYAERQDVLLWSADRLGAT